ncbi:VTC domain-containing protein [Streptomyces sp. A7024]|uniref:VTC domain-containing protein n=1 Tax=Streptomyces coryli TaxID=1128680 RepID=A0A6G4U434_9ACTN|nr:VTC domain-containing protein [Streptomyces coryli]NGN66047.1 VTC domain-containing protein [Streptomyces coryli]
MTPAERALARAAFAAAPVSLPELQARAELLARFDRSYFVPAPVFENFAARLRAAHGFRALAIDGRRTFAYHSVYFDTAGLRSYHDHRQGRRRRFKIRERLYEDSGERQFEIKLKGARGETVKRRRAMRPAERALGPEARGFLADVLRADYGLAAPGGLEPSLVTDYTRATFVADGQRITCDAGLLCVDSAGGRVRAHPDLVLVEVKSTGHLTPADRLLHRYGLRAAEFTKYCGALAAMRPDLPRNRWHRAVRVAFS